MKVTIVGAGVVGKATGEGLAVMGHDVHYVDTDRAVIADLCSRGHSAESPRSMSLDGVDAVFVSVPTPTNEFGIDASALLKATQSIGEVLRNATPNSVPLVVFRSTQPPGTTRNSLIPLLHKTSDRRINEGFRVAYWPEYLRAATAVQDFTNPRLIAIATMDRWDDSHIAAVRLAVDMEAAVHWLPLEAAELQKYVHNVGNAVKISVYNWFRLLAERIGMTPEDLDKVFTLCEQTAEGLWNPAYGLRDFGPYAGACLPKDVAALIRFAEAAGVDTGLLDAAERVNRQISDG
jgi:nucleotide sugar dehydrogenase